MRRSTGQGGATGEARADSNRYIWLAALGAALLLGSPAAANSDNPFAFDDGIPLQFQYAESRESPPPSISFRRNESRAVEAPTRYRTGSILKYSTPLGDSGMIFRVKLPLNPRKIIKLELRF